MSKKEGAYLLPPCDLSQSGYGEGSAVKGGVAWAPHLHEGETAKSERGGGGGEGEDGWRPKGQ